MKIVKVRIKKASKPTYWYADMIGSVFECYEHNSHISIINNSDFNRKHYDNIFYTMHCISKEDLEIIKESFVAYTQIKKLKF